MTAFRVRPALPCELTELEPWTRLKRPELSLVDEYTKEATRIWVAEDRAGIVRACLVFWVVADELQVVDLQTHPRARRQGAARALLHALREHGRQHGFRSIELEVRSSNDAALALYGSLDFHVVRCRKSYYSNGEDAVEMRHCLVP